MLSILVSRRAILVVSISTSAFVVTQAPAFGDVRYVRATASGTNDGSSWANAFTGVAAALNAAQSGDQIWVASGTYTPAPPGGSRNSSFELKAGVSMFGGFAGVETWLAERNFVANPTILSGDLNGNDSPATFDWTNHGENSYHVVRASGVGANTVLDGFVIRGGYADTPAPTDPYNGTGGGIAVSGGGPTGIHLRIEDNYALRGGGAADATLKRCTITSNQAQRGGGVHASVISLEGCRMFANRATIEGSAVKLLFGNGSSIANCLVYGNIGPNAAIHGEYVGGRVVNCTVAYNQATSAVCAGISDFGEANGLLVENSILWGNRGTSGPLEVQQIAGSGGYMNVYEGLSEPDWGGNIGSDPLFRDPDGADQVIGTSDDDYRLVFPSPSIDSGNNAFVPSGLVTDLAGRPRFVDEPLVPDGGSGLAPVVDRGAHEMSRTIVPRSRRTQVP